MTAIGRLAALAAGAIAAHRTKQAASTGSPQPQLTDEDRAYVEAWVAGEIQRLRALDYEELLLHEGEDFHSERLVPSGAYVLSETSVFWDDPDARTLRVFVDAAQPRSGRMPPSVAKEDFIRAPDGSFVDE